MRIWALTLTAAMVVGGYSDGWAGPKIDPTPDWRCRVVFRDAGSDKIVSDVGASYTDGAGGVTCYIVNEPGATHNRWLFMSITGTRRTPPARFVQFRGQTFEGASYPDFANHGTFEVKGLANVVWNPDFPSFRDVMPFRAYLRHPVLAVCTGPRRGERRQQLHGGRNRPTRPRLCSSSRSTRARGRSRPTRPRSRTPSSVCPASERALAPLPASCG